MELHDPSKQQTLVVIGPLFSTKAFLEGQSKRRRRGADIAARCLVRPEVSHICVAHPKVIEIWRPTTPA
jgi:hypothetical protein